MPFNHLNLCARDVPALSDILVRHFGFEVLQAGAIPEGVAGVSAGARYATLRDRDGFFLVLSQIDEAAPAAYPKQFHVGTMLAAPDAVRAKHAALCESGLQPKDIREFAALGARWTAFYCPVGDGIEIEVAYCSRDIAALDAEAGRDG